MVPVTSYKSSGLTQSLLRRGIHEIQFTIHKKTDTYQSSLLITEESCQEYEEEAAYGSVVRKLLIQALQWTASPSEAAWLGPEASTVNCTDHVMRLVSDIYQTWNAQSHQ